MEFAKRKSPRIPGYDYAKRNYYFITICTKDKRCIFGKPSDLNQYGRIAEACMKRIPNLYPQIAVDHYVIMPNHIHAILIAGALEQDHSIPSVTKVVGQYKMAVTKEIHKMEPELDVWQRSFHDHVIRDRAGYEKIWQYIEYNPLKWEEDCFYCENSRT